MDPSNSVKIVLCRLEDDLRIAVKGFCFILQERIYDPEDPLKYQWKDRLYNCWLGGILRGYVLYSLQRFARQDRSEDTVRLIEQIEKLDMEIGRVDGVVTSRLRKRMVDPVEKRLQVLVENDPIERFLTQGNSGGGCYG